MLPFPPITPLKVTWAYTYLCSGVLVPNEKAYLNHHFFFLKAMDFQKSGGFLLQGFLYLQ